MVVDELYWKIVMLKGAGLLHSEKSDLNAAAQEKEVVNVHELCECAASEPKLDALPGNMLVNEHPLLKSVTSALKMIDLTETIRAEESLALALPWEPMSSLLNHQQGVDLLTVDIPYYTGH